MCHAVGIDDQYACSVGVYSQVNARFFEFVCTGIVIETGFCQGVRSLPTSEWVLKRRSQEASQSLIKIQGHPLPSTTGAGTGAARAGTSACTSATAATAALTTGGGRLGWG